MVGSGRSVIGAFVVVLSNEGAAVVGIIVVVDRVVEALLISIADIKCKYNISRYLHTAIHINPYIP